MEATMVSTTNGQHESGQQVWSSMPVTSDFGMNPALPIAVPQGCVLVVVPVVFQEAAACGGWPAGGLQTSPAGGTLHMQATGAPEMPACTQPSGMCSELVRRCREHLASGPEGLAEALQMLREPGLVRALSFQAVGCRLVQDLLDVADIGTVSHIACQFRGFVIDAVRSPHGNYVVQKIIRTGSSDQVGFIAEELSNGGAWLAHHSYGCRVLCRLLEQAAEHEAVVQLLDAVLLRAEKSIVHKFGHHIIERILEHGCARQRQWVVDTLCRDILTFARNTSGAHVVEKALLCGTCTDQEALATAFLSCQPHEVAKLSSFDLGNVVLHALLKLPFALAQPLRKHLAQPEALNQLASCWRGRAFLGTSRESETESTRYPSGSHMSAEEDF